MGRITDGSAEKYVIDESGKKVDVARENRLRGVSGHSVLGASLAQGLPSLFMCVGAKIADGNSSRSEDTPESKETQLKEKRENLLRKLNIDPNTTGEALITAFNKNQQKYQDEITRITSDSTSTIKNLQGDVASSTEELARLTPGTQDYKNKEQEIQNLQKEIKAEQKKAADEIKEFQKKWSYESDIMQQVIDIDKQIASLADGGVGEKTDNLKKFNNAANNFRKNYMKGGVITDNAKNAAKELKEAYEGFGDKAPNSVTSLWKLYKDEVEFILKEETPAA